MASLLPRLGRAVRFWIQSPAAGRLRDVRPLSSMGVSGAQVAEKTRLKTIDDLPGPSQLELLYWFFVRGYLFRSHELEAKLRMKYGPMWKSTVAEVQFVNIASPELLEALLKQEDKYPMRADMAKWRRHRDLKGHSYGPLTEQGHRWHVLRTMMNKNIAKPGDVVRYTDSLNEVIGELLTKIKQLTEANPSGLEVKNVAELMYSFAFESICEIIFETRLGCLKSEISEETRNMIRSVGTMMENQVIIEHLPEWTSSWLPYWERFVESWDTLFAYGSKMINMKMEDIERRLQRGDDLGGAYITYLLTNGKLSLKEVVGLMPELLQAGIDTTSNTMTWALYQLARNPEIQNALYEEVMSVIPGEKVPAYEDLPKMPLLKAVVKETLRMYPVVPQNGRVITDKEAVLGGYVFPKNTLFVLSNYVLCYDENNFPEPHQFRPQRWLRSLGIKHHPFSSLPFGHGVRGCMGRRVAELEMHLALSQIIKKFQVLPGLEVKVINRVVLVSDIPIDLQFNERQT
ncbi:sterol 26-hydroxylase, mitochondrial-like [Hyperolius riggenbachi]|uniref:sterol 26-hydroxylase, mitochondrial-like n=1 Tax=Hyperolius riggenbachi TaxID=752182 RepID=UPI0035A3BF00